MKKLLAVLMAVLMVLCLAGCSQQETEVVDEINISEEVTKDNEYPSNFTNEEYISYLTDMYIGGEKSPINFVYNSNEETTRTLIQLPELGFTSIVDACTTSEGIVMVAIRNGEEAIIYLKGNLWGDDYYTVNWLSWLSYL